MIHWLWLLIPTLLAITALAVAIHALSLVLKILKSPWREVTIYTPALPVEDKERDS